MERSDADQYVQASSQGTVNRRVSDVAVSEVRPDAKLFGGYAGMPGHYDEASEAGRLRPHWRRFFDERASLVRRNFPAAGSRLSGCCTRTASRIQIRAIRPAGGVPGSSILIRF